MWADLGLRFVLGGVIVSVFSLLGDLFQPKSFSGLFSAAPSVALATLGLTFLTHDSHYVSLEGRSMLVGAIALFFSSQLVTRLLMRSPYHSLTVSCWAMLLWFGAAFGIWLWVLQR